jgi:hypothetical protein
LKPVWPVIRTFLLCQKEGVNVELFHERSKSDHRADTSVCPYGC